MKNIAIITARGGSKRIPKKNIKLFLGKPIIGYSIETALKSKLFDEVMVSTDDEEIAEIARKFGANVPFLRSSKNADDYSTTSDVLLEVLSEYESKNVHFDNACCIYPTAPFIQYDHLKEAFDILIFENADTVLPITEFSFPIWRSFKLDGNKITYNWDEFALKRSQDLPKSYHDCGQFYFFNVKKFIKSKKLVTENSRSIILPESQVQDIDTLEDWIVAELKYKSIHLI